MGLEHLLDQTYSQVQRCINASLLVSEHVLGMALSSGQADAQDAQTKNSTTSSNVSGMRGCRYSERPLREHMRVCVLGRSRPTPTAATHTYYYVPAQFEVTKAKDW